MTGWTTAGDLRAQVQRLWDKGRLLAALVEPGDGFPLRLALKAPSSAELSDRFDEARAWSRSLQPAQGSGYRLVLREFRHRVLGNNALPGEAWVDSLDDALRLIGKTADGRRFVALVATTRERLPALLPWLQANPLRALALAGEWPTLLAIVLWLRANPRPNVYLRQVDLPGVHSKTIEASAGVLAELLDLALPPEAVDAAFSGTANFARRYGFRSKPVRVRFRMLDRGQSLLSTGVEEDIALNHDAFARLDPPVSRVFVTENEINFLAFPPAPDALVLFGAGYGFDKLAEARWLNDRTLHYWGDIDTHGFAILDQLRGHFAHVESFLMDRDTLLVHELQWTDEPQPTLRDLPGLTAEERALYDALRWKRLGERPIRLEQERIGFRWLERAVAATSGDLGGASAVMGDLRSPQAS